MKMANVLFATALCGVIMFSLPAFGGEWKYGFDKKVEATDETTTTKTTQFDWGEEGETWFVIGMEANFVPYEEHLTSFSKLVVGLEVPLMFGAYIEPDLMVGIWRPDVNKMTSVWLAGGSLNLGYEVVDYFHVRAGGELLIMDGRYRQDEEIIQGHWGGDLVFLPVESLEFLISASVSSFGWNYRNDEERDRMAPDFYLGFGLLYRVGMFTDT